MWYLLFAREPPKVWLPAYGPVCLGKARRRKLVNQTMEKSLGQFLWYSLRIEVPGSSAWVWLAWGWSKVLNLDSNTLQKSTRHCAPNLVWGGQLQSEITNGGAWNITQGFCHTVDSSKQQLGFSETWMWSILICSVIYAFISFLVFIIETFIDRKFYCLSTSGSPFFPGILEDYTCLAPGS